MKHDIIIIDTDGKIKTKSEELIGYGTLFGSVTGSGNPTGTTILYGTFCGSVSGGTVSASTIPAADKGDE